MFTTEYNLFANTIMKRELIERELFDCQSCYREYYASELFPFQDIQVCQECIETDLRLK